MIRTIPFDNPDGFDQTGENETPGHGACDEDHHDMISQMDHFTDRFDYYEVFIQKLLKQNDTMYDKWIDLQDENYMVKRELLKLKLQYNVR